MLAIPQERLAKNLSSSSALVKAAPGTVAGVVINSHSSGTLKLWDNTVGSGTVLFNTISFAVGEHYIDLFNAKFSIGLYATIGGTADITILYN